MLLYAFCTTVLFGCGSRAVETQNDNTADEVETSASEAVVETVALAEQETAEKKVEALKAKGASEEVIAKAQLKATILRENADEDKARRDEMAAVTLANAKAVSWNASKENLAKLQAKEGVSEEELAKAQAAVEERWAQALESAEKRDAAIAFYAQTQERINAARAARA